MKARIALGALMVLTAAVAPSSAGSTTRSLRSEASGSRTPPSDGDDPVAGQADALLADGQYERAAEYIEQNLPDARDKSYLYLRLSQAQYRRGQARSGFLSFRKALESLPAPQAPETADATVEQQVQVASVFRIHSSLTVASRLLEGLQRAHGDYSTVLYEIGYLRLNERDIPGFYENYYQAYRRNRGNPWSLPGWAIVRDYTDEDKLTAQDSPWLAVAAYHYDNPKVWVNILQSLDRKGLMDNAEAAAHTAARLPEHMREVFFCQYYAARGLKEQAAQAAAAIPSTREANYRFDMFRRKLLLEMGLKDKAIEGLGAAPTDPYRRILYYEFRTCYSPQGTMDQEGLAAAGSFVDAVAAMAEPIVADARKLGEIRNTIVRQLAGDQIEKRDYLAAMQILATQQQTLDERSCDLIASLYLQSDKYANAILWMEYQLTKASPDGRADVVRRLIDYAALAEKWDVVEKYLAYASKAPLPRIVEEYKGCLSRRGQGAAGSHWVRNVPGCYRVTWPTSSWRRDALGPCAWASAWSLLRFHGQPAELADIIQQCEVPAEGRKDSVEKLASVFSGKGLEVRFLAPRKDVARALLGRGLPLVLIRHVVEDGLVLGHASVLYGFDDRVGEFFCREREGPGETRIHYDDLIDSRVMVLVAPGAAMKAALTEQIAPYVISSGGGRLSAPEHARLTGLGGEVKYWALRRLGEALHIEEDWAGARQQFEQATQVRTSKDLELYENLAECCLKEKASTKALAYIQQGLALEPGALQLLAWYVEVKAGLDKVGGDLDPGVAKELLAVTEKMQAVNPDYAYAYFLRGDLLARQKQWQAALTAFLKCIETFDAMPPEYQKDNAAWRRHAQSALRICRMAILQDAKAGK